MEESLHQRESADAEELRVAEASMISARDEALDSLRKRNAEWEERQAELKTLKESRGNLEQEQQEKEGGGKEMDEECEEEEGEGSVDERQDQVEEQEEEEEEDILAALDGKIKARKVGSAGTKLDASDKKVVEFEENLEQGPEHHAVNSVEHDQFIKTTREFDLKHELLPEEVAVHHLPMPHESEGHHYLRGHEEKDHKPAADSSSVEVDVVADTKVVAFQEAVEPVVVFDYEAESRDLAMLTVAQLKAVAAEEGVVLRKGKMLKKHYVEDICQARQQKV